MALRNIVKIDKNKCNGCGECVTACAEGAIEIINGKAELVSETYCDGLGACLGHCPQDAITIEKRNADEFNEEAVETYLKEKKQCISFECPGMAAKTLGDRPEPDPQSTDASSQLSHWPVQLKLVSPQAAYFKDADLLLAADCVPFAMGNFHSKFLKGKSVVIGCPKLDDAEFYIEKLAEILKTNNIKSLTVVHMEVPCCGFTPIAEKAIALAKSTLSFKDVTIALDGSIKGETTV